MTAITKKATILTRLRRAEHKDTARGVSMNVYVYINKSGSGKVGVGSVSVPFDNIGQGIAVMAELMGAKAKAAARRKG